MILGSWDKMSYLLQCAVLVAIIATVSGESTDSYRLFTKLMANYSKDIRPVAMSSDSIVVRFGMALQQIIDMDERNQIITTNMWLRQNWADNNLRWEPEDYGGVTKLTIPSSDIWKPDIILYNTADSSFKGAMKTNAEVTHDGAVVWNAPAIFKSSCKIDINYFPFDKQECVLQFGSWAYTTEHLNLVNRSGAGDVSAYIKNGEWNMIDFPVYRRLFQYLCCPYPFSVLDFVIVIKRRPLFYVVMMLAPCILISALTLLTFYLPADAGEKFTLCVTILLSLTVFLLLAAETMPPTSEVVPLISRYYIATGILVSFSTVLTTIVLYIHHRGTYVGRAPAWLRRWSFNYLSKLLCIRDCEDTDDDDDKQIPRINFENASGNGDGPKAIEAGHDKTPLELDVANLQKEMVEIDENSHHQPDRRGRIRATLSNIASCLQSITERKEDGIVGDEIVNEWIRIAFVFDRLFMWAFGLGTVIATCTVLLQGINE